MTRTELEAYDKGFLHGANLRVEELREAEGAIETYRRAHRGERLAFVATAIWGAVMTLMAMWLAVR